MCQEPILSNSVVWGKKFNREGVVLTVDDFGEDFHRQLLHEVEFRGPPLRAARFLSLARCKMYDEAHGPHVGRRVKRPFYYFPAICKSRLPSRAGISLPILSHSTRSIHLWTSIRMFVQVLYLDLE